MVAFAALVLWLRYFGLPNVDQYRGEIVAQIERASGMAISVGAIRGGWDGLRPVLSLEGLTISDRRGKAALQLQRAEASLAWWALLVGEVRFHDVDFYRPDLELRRGADGLIYLADKPLNEAGPTGDGKFTEWLLAQPRLGIHDATLTWRDDFLGAPEVRLASVEIAVRKRRGHHRAALTAVPPAELGRRVDLRADVAVEREGTLWRARGSAYAETLDTDFGRLRAHLPLPETLRSGVGSVRVWMQFAPGSVEEVVADLDVRGARAQLAADALPLELASLSGRATYRAREDGFTFATEGLRFALPSGVEAKPGNFSLTRTTPPSAAPRIEVRADGIDIKIAATLVDYFPLPRDIKNQVLRFAPRGRIAEAAVGWSEDGARSYAVKGRFEDLAINAVDALPGIEGFTGVIEGTQAGGTLMLAARSAVIDLSQVFREPLRLDALDARARWKHEGGALEVAIEEASFANADAEGKLSGTWRSLPNSPQRSPGFIDLKGSLARANAAAVANYMPNRLANTRDWLARAVQAGQAPRVAFELKGDLFEFPYGGESSGRFLVEGDLRGGRIAYHPLWPSVDAIDGTFRFENRRMEIRAERAAIFRSRVRSASAVIEDLAQRPPLLVIDGEIETTGFDTVRFLRESPLVEGPGAFTRAIAVEGPARLKLHLDFPLAGTEPVRVAGEYQFTGAAASVSRELTLTDLRGRLAFTERGVRAPELVGTLFGQPARLAMATEDRQLVTTLTGRIDAPALGAFVPAAVRARLQGATEWSARIVSGPQGTDVALATDLKGLAVTLPAPLGKAAEESRPSSLQVARLGSERELTTVALGPEVHGRLSRARPAGFAEERWSVALGFGAPLAGQPVREGVWLYGSLPALDVDAWQEVFGTAGGEPRAAPAAVELRGIDMKLARVRFMGRDFIDTAAQLERRAGSWSGRLQGPLVSGEVAWSPEGKGRIVAKLERLAIPDPAAAQAARAQQGLQPADLPDLDVTAARFDFRGRHFGRLQLKAETHGEEWRIEKLDIEAPHSAFTSTGAWRKTGAGSITTLAVKLDAKNLNGLFAVFGFGDYLRRGVGQLEGTLAWPGQPHEFAAANLSGSIKVTASRGQFAKMDPGAGKLLGLLSLQSLPRRAMLDFRDVFSEGFAFDKIEGDVRVAKGILLTEDFEIGGPAAFVSLAGEVSLPQETQSLTLRVVPEVGEGIALAATVIGTPVLGLSTLLVSKLLRNPFGKVVAYEYLVTGSWDNPVVTRLGAPPAAPAAPSPAKAAASP